ncbi:hypothetical protein SAMN02745165_01331 [Malonomonas rubra DSM 5091]|uniref:Aminoglycoside phosphotransferase domain-containing protein n=1 Tax=Malonomonas rubra DSM 5091 TaxID=1122189 RepID=A0A1M6FL96_MALRU|nr:bifunctional aminoglycoside phosphotransferase/ATP-binding protein [Malonomonas rubra]SHI98481.1 hypothetical protein SAMN02745165_01331 [Malonomonas rubra DSM 5091]
MKRNQEILVKSLHSPAFYPHPVERVKLVETHISFIFLAGNYAYKLKKPVNFGFLNYSTLEQRRHFCAEELRLNRRFAPELYLDVVSIGNTPAEPILNGLPAIDYMVRMHRFPPQDELDQMLVEERLTAQIMEQFAEYLASCHQHAPEVTTNSRFGTAAAIHQPEMENFSQIRPLLDDPRHQAQLDRLEAWTETTHERLRDQLEERKTTGFIRECHGDVHLANMLWHQGKPRLFDCIEFNDNLRCIDPVCDYAFLLMDLADRGTKELGGYFLNRYLQQSGDFSGLALLNYYCCYRAMVRAKVFCLRLQQSGVSEEERQRDAQLLESYLKLAEDYSSDRPQALIICHGFSASGKSTCVRQLAPRLDAISINSDIERKRLFGFTATAKSHSAPAGGIYTQQANEKTYSCLLEQTARIIEAGFPAIIDATFLRQSRRQQAEALAESLRVPFIILDFPLPEVELFRRVEQRSQQNGKISEADATVLSQQLAKNQPLSDREQIKCIKVLSESSLDEIAGRIAKLAR